MPSDEERRLQPGDPFGYRDSGRTLRAGGRSAAWLDRLASTIRTAGSSGQSGDRVRPIMARLIGSASPYSWVEVYPDPDGTGWINHDGGRGGTATAYEVNGLAGLTGEIARLRTGGPGDYRFQHARLGTVIDDDCIHPGELRVRVPVVIDIDCEDTTPRDIAGVGVTLTQGVISLVRSTGGNPIEAIFSAADLATAGFVPGPATLTACISTEDGECCTGPHAVTLVCPDSSITLPTLVCAYGIKFYPSISTCPCLGLTFTADYLLSDGTTVEVSFEFGATTAEWTASPSEICVINKVGGPATIDSIIVTSTSRPNVYDIVNATVDLVSGVTVPLKPAYVCPCVGVNFILPGVNAVQGPLPRTLYLTDEFGTVELTYAIFECNDNQNPPIVTTVCGWCGKGVNPGDPDATVYDACGDGFNSYKDQTASVPIYYRIERGVAECQRRSNLATARWRLVRGAMSRATGGLFHCDNKAEVRPCAPAIAPDCATEFPTVAQICCDYHDCVELGFTNRGAFGIGLSNEQFCGDDAVIMQFGITGPLDDEFASPVPRYGMQKYTNGSAIVTSASP